MQFWTTYLVEAMNLPDEWDLDPARQSLERMSITFSLLLSETEMRKLYGQTQEKVRKVVCEIKHVDNIHFPFELFKTWAIDLNNV